MPLGVSRRTTRRWVERYEDGDVDALMDKRLGRFAANAATVDEVMDLVVNYRERHEGWNMRHYSDYYRDAGGRRSPCRVRKHLQAARAALRCNAEGTHREQHQPAPMPGMVLHQDASTREWVPRVKWDLVVAMDDATNESHSAFFCEAKGLFCEMRTDRSSYCWRPAEVGGKVDKAHPTQLKRTMDSLGTHLETAYSPQAKGRSERMFGTLQGGCLPQELALASITDMAEANAWLHTMHIPRHNKWLAQKAKLNGESAFMPEVDKSVLNGVLCETHERIVRNGNCASFKDMTLQIPAQPHRPNYRKTTVSVRRYLDGSLSMWHSPRRLSKHDADGRLPAEPTPGKIRAKAA